MHVGLEIYREMMRAIVGVLIVLLSLMELRRLRRRCLRKGGRGVTVLGSSARARDMGMFSMEEMSMLLLSA